MMAVEMTIMSLQGARYMLRRPWRSVLDPKQCRINGNAVVGGAPPVGCFPVSETSKLSLRSHTVFLVTLCVLVFSNCLSHDVSRFRMAS